MTDNQNILNDLIKKFDNVTKRILQNRPLSTKKEKRNEYIKLLVENYNTIISYTSLNIEQLSETTKTNTFKRIIHCRQLLVKCFDRLESRIKVPHDIFLFELVSYEGLSEADTKIDLETEEENTEIKEGTTGRKFFETEMATIDQKKSFISLCSGIIRENYDGNPLALESFLDKINLIQDLTEENLNSTFISFVKSKLEGKAREALPENVNTIESIKTALKIK